ncbi:MAG: hypothetical protein AAFY82_05180, partial [Pseudomonadota bacterium]
ALSQQVEDRIQGRMQERGVYSNTVKASVDLSQYKDKRINLIMKVRTNKSLGYISGLNSKIFSELCAPWTNSTMGQSGFKMYLSFEREGGDFIASQLVSDKSCQLYYDYERRRGV